MKAVAHYNSRPSSPKDPDSIGDPRVLERISVDFLQNELASRWDEESFLKSIEGLVGAAAARLAIRRKVVAAIATAYPRLANECDQQWSNFSITPGKVLLQLVEFGHAAHSTRHP